MNDSKIIELIGYSSKPELLGLKYCVTCSAACGGTYA